MMVLAFAPPPAPPAHVRKLTLADLRQGVALSDPKISPDGKRIVLTIRRNDYVKDRALIDVVIVDARTHAIRRLLHNVRDLRGVAWSEDGSRLAYVALAQPDPDEKDAEARPQLFVLPMDGGAPVQITHEKTGVDGFTWRPDGAALVYASAAEPNAKAIKHHEDAFEVIDLPWTAQEGPVPDILYEVGAGGGHSQRVGRGDLRVSAGFTYTADGHSLIITRRIDHQPETHYLSRELIRVAIGSGAVTTLPKLSIAQGDPLRSRRGSIAFVLGNPKGSMQREIALADQNGTHGRIVTLGLDRNVGGAAFAPDGSLVVSANDGTQRRLFHIGTNGGVTALDLGKLSAYGFSIAHDGTIAFVAGAPDRPSELYLLRPGSKTPGRLTNYNRWIDSYALGRTYQVGWPTFDGLKADGVVTAPPGFDLRKPFGNKRFPLVVYIHGGPTAASTTGYNGFVQVMAAHGWFVFQPNYRGSDNLGLRFARTTVPHITSVPGRDIEDGLGVMNAFPIDMSRVGVSGWSEGGLMTSWLITQDHRWRAAVSGAAVNDWVQYGDMTDAQDFTKEFIGPSPWSDGAQMQLYERESPLTYAGDVKTPTLIMSDAGDFRVPTPLAYEFYHEIRATGTPVEFVIFPVTGHFPSDPVRAEDVNRRWEAWFVKYLAP
jgi:dipeptidyl aminopeptidase/acylaminoacyl peptidase